VVLDVLRASSTIVTLLERGAHPLYVAGTVDAARALAEGLPDRPLLCGESDGLPPPGFDYGNSPTELGALDLRGRGTVLATSNGTRALAALAAAPAVLIGCFLNATAVAASAAALARRQRADVALVCAGDNSGTQFSLEDALAAGCIVDRLWPAEAPATSTVALDDGARAAWHLYHSYAARATPSGAAALAFAEAVHGRELEALGLGHDLAYCARVDASAVVPELLQQEAALLLRARPE
jgi:2-phosphosulfolactate phosphatase